MSQVLKPLLKKVWSKDDDSVYDIDINELTTKINQKFLLNYNLSDDTLNIYALNSVSLLNSIKLQKLYFFNFHKHYETIFFICNERNISIYLINETDKTIEKLSTVNGHYNKVIFADFSPFNPNIFVSISNNYDIKVYDIRKPIPISHIFIDEKLNRNIELQWDDDRMGIISNKKIIFFDYINFIKDEVKEISFEEKIINFIFYDKIYLILLTKTKILFFQEKDKWRTIEEINEELLNIFFNRKEKILILFFGEVIKGLFIGYSYVSTRFELKVDNPRKLKYITPINEKFLKENELCKFYSTKKSINFYIITNENNNISTDENYINNNSNISNNNQVHDENELKKFLNNIIKNIWDIKLLLSKENNKEVDSHINNKKYFNYPEIVKELKLIQTLSLLERRKKVIEGINNIDIKPDIKNIYFELLKLLIKDNTNKELIIKYLKFLNNNKEKLHTYFINNIEEYESELAYYLYMFNTEEAFNDFKITKKSNKEELINFLDNLSKYNDINEFEKYIKSFKAENVILFNMPIKSENKELCYYRYLNIIKYYLKKLKILIQDKENDINKEKIDENTKKMNYNKFLKEQMNIFTHKMAKTKDAIEKNIVREEKLEYLIILSSEASDILEYEFCYNLITSENMSDKEIDEYKINNCMNDYKTNLNNSNNDENMKNKGINIIINNNCKNDNDIINNNIKKEEKIKFLCKNNIGLYKDDLYYSKKIYNYNYYNQRIPKKYHLSKLKDFYKKILPKKCFKSIYTTLYNEEYYPFEDQNFTNDFIDKNFNFIPMKLDDANGFTDKYSMKIFISSFLPKMIGGSKNSKNEQNLLREGLIIGVTNHEIGHCFVLINFYMENARISIDTPRKKLIDDNDAEGGNYIEYALYGRTLETINIEQALYLLNEKNYDKSFLEFQEGFNNIKKEDIEIQGVFKDIFNNINIDDLESNKNNIKNRYIPLNKKNISEKVIVKNVKNDVIGKRIFYE